MTTVEQRETALDGLRVLETGGEIGALCGKLLSDMGASVVKIEPPGGDPTRRIGPFREDRPDPNSSLYFWHYNTNKRSVTLDIAQASGRELFLRLAANSDVVLDSHPPGELDRYGIGHRVLQEREPRLVVVAITPFGQDGPMRELESTDLTAMAFAGPVWSCGYDDHSLPPVRPEGNQAYHTACVFAAIGVMAAVLHRDRTGLGQFVDVNVHGASNVCTEGATVGWLLGRRTAQRQTGRAASPQKGLPWQVRCADGHYLNIGPVPRTIEVWLSLAAWLNEEGIIEDLSEHVKIPEAEAVLRRDEVSVQAWQPLYRGIQELATRKTAYQMFRGGQERGLMWGKIYAPEEILDDPHFQERGFPVEVEHPELRRTFTYPGAPYRFSGTPWSIRRRAPLLGEDNAEVYVGELGLTPMELVTLREAGVV
jgi:crotonobetainyl-CoA:carnitine CoA-transferase CaiB-like acyl-CoA transferase